MKKSQKIVFTAVVFSLVAALTIGLWPAPKAAAQSTFTRLTITVTNFAFTGDTVVVGTDTRVFTNKTEGFTFILTNLVSTGELATNIFNALSLARPFPPTLNIRQPTTNTVELSSISAFEVQITGTWGTTNSVVTTGTNKYDVSFPWSALPAPQQVDQASEMIVGLNLHPTNLFDSTAPVMQNYLSLNNTNTSFNKTLSNSVIEFTTLTNNWIGGNTNNGTIFDGLYEAPDITNAPSISGTFGLIDGGGGTDLTNVIIHSPILTNGRNFGIAFSSPGSGADSENFGTGSGAEGVRSTVLGKDVTSLGDDSVVVGYAGSNPDAAFDRTTLIGANIVGTGIDNVGVGESVTTSGQGSVVLGANGNDNGFTNAVVFCQGVGGTADNHFTMGDSEHLVDVAGVLLPKLTSNEVHVGHTVFTNEMALAYHAAVVTSLGDGVNLSITATNPYTQFTGTLTANAIIAGIASGYNGQRIIHQNETGFELSYEQDTVDPTPANRITTPTGAKVPVAQGSSIKLVYDATASKWDIENVWPDATIVVPEDANATNFHTWPGSPTEWSLTVHSLAGGISNSLQVLDTNGTPVVYVATNGAAEPTLVASNTSIKGSAIFTGGVTNLSDVRLEGNLNFDGDTILVRDGGANTLAMRNGTALQLFRVYFTFTDAGNHSGFQLIPTTAIAGNQSLLFQARTAGTGADNIDLIFQPAGKGTIYTGSAADFTATGGLARGDYSRDWQQYRSASTQIASGLHSAILVGTNNTASASFSIASGFAAVADHYGEQARSSGRFSADGDAQGSDFLARVQTTDATANVEAFLDGSSARLTIAVGETMSFSILVAAERTDSDTEGAGYTLTGAIANNAGTTALIGAVQKVSFEDDATWDVDASASDANDALQMDVTGAVGKNINWVFNVRATKVN